MRLLSTNGMIQTVRAEEWRSHVSKHYGMIQTVRAEEAQPRLEALRNDTNRSC